MRGLLTGEWIKLRRRWMPRVIILLLMLQSLQFVGRHRLGAGHDTGALLPQAWVVALIFAGFVGPYYWPVLGGSWAGSEYAWGTLGLVLSRRPFRIRFVGAALLILLLCGTIGLVALLTAFSATCLLVAALTHTAAFDASAFSLSFATTLGKTFLTTLFVTGYFLILSYTAGTVFRSSAIGIAIGIGSSLAQIILGGMFSRLGGMWAELAAHFPFPYAQALVARVSAPAFSPGDGPASIDPGIPQIGESLLFLTLYVAILLATTLVAVCNRDVTS